MNRQIKAGIAGAAGYTGGELIRLLLLHPSVEIAFAMSRSHAGKRVSEVHTDLTGDTDLCFTPGITETADVLFLCLPHGESATFLRTNALPASTKVIDLGNDFRLKTPDAGDWVYGLPELNRALIATGSYKVANPGCFATAIQLALLPLAANGWLSDDIHVNATTGSTGAGQAVSATGHFSWRNNNVSAYKAFTHQHLPEIAQSVQQLQDHFQAAIHFIPVRGNFTRGIFATLYTRCTADLDTVRKQFADYYAIHPFVHTSDRCIDLKQVVNTNKCLLHLEKHDDNLLITSAIDNLLKGASGQAVQNMNLLFGLEETSGLRLKASAF